MSTAEREVRRLEALADLAHASLGFVEVGDQVRLQGLVIEGVQGLVWPFGRPKPGEFTEVPR